MNCAPDGSALNSSLAWGAALGGGPLFDRRVAGRVPARIRRWRNIDPAITHPALDQHFVSVHLGGAKRLHREGDGHKLTRDIASPAYSFVPAGADFRWMTEGPVDFLHIYLDQATFSQFIAENFDRDPDKVSIHDALGQSDPLMLGLLPELVAELTRADGQIQAYADDLLHLLLFRLLKLHSNAALSLDHAPLAMAPVRLRRAIEFIDENYGTAIGLADIAAAAGVSPFHFSRIFRQATGKSPYAFLLDRRIAEAMRLLASCDRSVCEVAQHTGFGGASQFSRLFRQTTGFSPREYRNSR